MTAHTLTLAKKSPMKTTRVFGTMLFMSAHSSSAPSTGLSRNMRCDVFGAVMILAQLSDRKALQGMTPKSFRLFG